MWYYNHLFAIFSVLFVISESSAQLKIGSQTWGDENLSVTTFQNGDPIIEARTPSEFDKFSNQGIPTFMRGTDYNPWSVTPYMKDFFGYQSKFSCEKIDCGFVYNWFAVNDARGLAPAGWRVASREDWLYLEKYYESKKGTYKIAWDLVLDGFLGGTYWTSSRVPGIQSNNSYSKYFSSVHGGSIVKTQQLDRRVGSWVRCVKNQ